MSTQEVPGYNFSCLKIYLKASSGCFLELLEEKQVTCAHKLVQKTIFSSDTDRGCTSFSTLFVWKDSGGPRASLATWHILLWSRLPAMRALHIWTDVWHFVCSVVLDVISGESRADSRLWIVRNGSIFVLIWILKWLGNALLIWIHCSRMLLKLILEKILNEQFSRAIITNLWSELTWRSSKMKEQTDSHYGLCEMTCH